MARLDSDRPGKIILKIKLLFSKRFADYSGVILVNLNFLKLISSFRLWSEITDFWQILRDLWIFMDLQMDNKRIYSDYYTIYILLVIDSSGLIQNDVSRRKSDIRIWPIRSRDFKFWYWLNFLGFQSSCNNFDQSELIMLNEINLTRPDIDWSITWPKNFIQILKIQSRTRIVSSAPKPIVIILVCNRPIYIPSKNPWSSENYDLNSPKKSITRKTVDSPKK